MKKILVVFALLCAISCSVQSPKCDVIFDTDANNELDDQHALAYLLLNQDNFNTLGITTNNTHNGGGIAGQTEEASRVVRMCGPFGKGIEVFDGAEANFENIKESVEGYEFDGYKAVNFIINNALNYSPENKLTVIAVGKLTNIALALKKQPKICDNIRLVWLGSNYPAPGEYNLEDDIPSMNYILDSNIEFEIVTVRYRQSNGTDAVRVTREYVDENFSGKGPYVKVGVEGRHGGTFTCFGDYSVNLFDHIKLKDDGTRSLFDLCAVAVVKNASWAQKIELPAPTMIDGEWVDRPDNTRMISLWENFDKNSIVNDLVATLNKTTQRKAR